MYVLVIDDDPMVCKTAKFLLTEEGYEVETALSGAAAVDLIGQRQPDLFVLDMVLPDVDGFQIYTQLQQANADARILFLTPRGWLDDCTIGLELNVGVFLAKPFGAEEFISCVNSLAWRSLTQRENRWEDRIAVGNAELRINASRLVIKVGNVLQLVSLTPPEVNLLRCLMLNPGNVVPGDVLMDGLWQNVSGDDGVQHVEAHMRGLLTKIAHALPEMSDSRDAGYIEPVGARGFKFNVITA